MHMATSLPAPARRAKARRSFRAFYITTVLLSAFALIALTAEQGAKWRLGSQYGLVQREAVAELDSMRLIKRDEECRLVRHVEDKCAFIKANCPDEEAGLFSYLSLYYCSLPNAQPLAFIILVLWLGLLFSTISIAASDFFCVNLSTIASILGMSESMAGVTFLAFGNGSPDVFSTFAAMSTHSGSLAIGELIGAAGFITAVVAGSMALVREFKVGKKTFVRDVGFFIVAASFSMSFIADGELHLWECCAMIGFYVFYVIFVVAWHWYLQQRRRRREFDALARGHYVAADSAEIEVLEEDDGEDEDLPAGQRRSSRTTEDFSALERGYSPIGRHVDSDDDSEGDGEQGRILATEMTNSMRLVRPGGSRRTTINPIRPSLVGALEFRSILSSLQKSRSTQTRPIHLRRYSDEPTHPHTGLNSPIGSTAVSEYGDSVVVTSEGAGENIQGTSMNRGRAVSMNDASNRQPLDPAAFSVARLSTTGMLAARPTFPRYLDVPDDGQPGRNSNGDTRPARKDESRSPTISISPPGSIALSRDSSPFSTTPHQDRESLAPLDHGYPGARHLRDKTLLTNHPADIVPVDNRLPRRPRLSIPRKSDSYRGQSPSAASPFPRYTDSPLPLTPLNGDVAAFLLPEPAVGSEEVTLEETLGTSRRSRIRWWPYQFLPAPRVVASTLFPTLMNWRSKTIIDQFLSFLSAPSVFLLAITLPVVESEISEDSPGQSEAPFQTSRTQSGTMPRLPADSPALDEQEPEWLRYRRSTRDRSGTSMKSPMISGYGGHGNAAAVAIGVEEDHNNPHSLPLSSKRTSVPVSDAESIDSSLNTANSGNWNRWLVIVQIFTAPLFVMTIIWANTAEDTLDFRLLLRLVLYSLLGSMIVLAILLLTTTRDKAPRYRPLLCFLGFVVSIAWISTIANEVVGVLKAVGVILGISDAILGLTIFAVGNSLGDLVADVTVARLGYPVMALSACFGGPMLNILLGIGISGLYMTIKEADHKHEKHPGKPLRYKPYRLEVGGTLLISGLVLLITLVGLLIVLPLNKWVMSKRIGWGLIILWSIGTVINLVIEITGVMD